MEGESVIEKSVFNYKWTLKNAKFTKDKGTVFSCFAGGGGSTMGYKLAGFDVLGCNELDLKMIEIYEVNHSPKYSYLESIQDFKCRNDLPKELYNLDILDGSPPCSSFSIQGNREKDWGKKKNFQEGQAKQILDTLFFDFIDLVKKLQPKVVIAENVKGLLFGNAKKYVRRIYEEFGGAGYYCQHWVLDSSKMGVPQKRERVFFICLRKDLASPFLYKKDFLTQVPKLELKFNIPVIPFKEIEDNKDNKIVQLTTRNSYWHKVNYGDTFSSRHPKGHLFSDYKTNPNKPLRTIIANPSAGGWHYAIKRRLNKNELIKGGSFPMDYDFKNLKHKYVIGMSVPPVMTAQIATQIYNQWLSHL